MPRVAGEDLQALPTLSGWMLLKSALQSDQPTIARPQILTQKNCIQWCIQWYSHGFSPHPRLDVIFPGSRQMTGFQSLFHAFGPCTSIWQSRRASPKRIKQVAVDPIDSALDDCALTQHHLNKFEGISSVRASSTSGSHCWMLRCLTFTDGVVFKHFQFGEYMRDHEGVCVCVKIALLLIFVWCDDSSQAKNVISSEGDTRVKDAFGKYHPPKPILCPLLLASSDCKNGSTHTHNRRIIAHLIPCPSRPSLAASQLRIASLYPGTASS